MDSGTTFLLACLLFTCIGLFILIVLLNCNDCCRRQEPVQRLLYQYSDSERVVSENLDKVDLCSICLSPVQSRDNIKIKCNHLFHTYCIDQWTDKNIKKNKLPSCPNCNESYLERVV